MPRFVDDFKEKHESIAEVFIRSKSADSMDIVVNITRRGAFWTLPTSILPQWISRACS